MASLRDPNPRENVIGRFMLVQEGERAVPALMKEIKEGNGSRSMAAQALGEIKSLTPVPELLEMLNNESNSSIALKVLLELVKHLPVEKLGELEQMLPKKEPAKAQSVDEGVAMLAFDRLAEAIGKRRNEKTERLSLKAPRGTTESKKPVKGFLS
ncbi:MAG: hypothetical protein ABII71_00045 [Candidatus Micrarchaeota archaeon]